MGALKQLSLTKDTIRLLRTRIFHGIVYDRPSGNDDDHVASLRIRADRGKGGWQGLVHAELHVS
jgi:hypothetical protein